MTADEFARLPRTFITAPAISDARPRAIASRRRCTHSLHSIFSRLHPLHRFFSWFKNWTRSVWLSHLSSEISRQRMEVARLPTFFLMNILGSMVNVCMVVQRRCVAEVLSWVWYIFGSGLNVRGRGNAVFVFVQVPYLLGFYV